MTLGPSINVGTDRIPAYGAAPGLGDYSPDIQAIGFFNETDRVQSLLRSLPTVHLHALVEYAEQELAARGQ